MGDQRKRFKKSPLIEVLCEFHFDSDQKWNPRLPDLIQEKLKSEFPVRKDVRHFEAQIELAPTGVKYATKEYPRVQLRMGNNSALVQVGENFLTVNHLVPYTSWETLRERTRTAWKTYVEEAHPRQVKSAAVQYINRIEFDHATITLEKFLDFYPHVGPRLPQKHGNFFVGVEWQFDGGKNTLRAELAPVPPGERKAVTLLLVLHYTGQIESARESDVFSWLDAGHQRLYETFISMLTEESRRLFEQE